MDIYIIRHAWAADRDDPQWPDDSLRPLTDEGKRRFAKVASILIERDMAPEIIATSPLVRCVETAAILAAAIGRKGDSPHLCEAPSGPFRQMGTVPFSPDVVKLDELRPGSDLEGLMRWTMRQARKHQQIAWVGHAPDVDRLTGALIGASEGLIRFSKGSAAAIRFEGPPDFGAGELRWLVTAKVLGC